MTPEPNILRNVPLSGLRLSESRLVDGKWQIVEMSEADQADYEAGIRGQILALGHRSKTECGDA